MWICFNDGFVSAVQNTNLADGLVVRARRREILDGLFADKEVIVGGSTDYNYRVFVSKTDFVGVVASRISEIYYPNFKNSVEEPELHKLYADFWRFHYEYQR